MALKYPDRLESNNPAAYGIVKAIEVAGHKTVQALDNLYSLADAILSDSKTNANNDAIGQTWYVISESKSYRLIDWNNRHQASGWELADAGLNSDIEDVQTALEEFKSTVASTYLEKANSGIGVLKGYTRSTESNENLYIETTDTINQGLGKLEKAILDNEEVTANTFVELKEAIGLTEDITLPDLTSTNYLDGQTSIINCLKELDTELKTTNDNLASEVGDVEDLINNIPSTVITNVADFIVSGDSMSYQITKATKQSNGTWTTANSTYDIPLATTTTAGLLSLEEKKKLNYITLGDTGITSIAFNAAATDSASFTIGSEVDEEQELTVLVFNIEDNVPEDAIQFRSRQWREEGSIRRVVAQIDTELKALNPTSNTLERVLTQSDFKTVNNTSIIGSGNIDVRLSWRTIE